MSVSPVSGFSTVSSSPFSAESGNSANPFGSFGPHDCRADLLVVEGDFASADRLCGELRANGFQTVAAFSGEDGLAVLQARSFDIILLDWLLPRGNGLDMLRTLRAREERTPVFLTNTSDAVEDRILAFESGADDYLVKPFILPDLLARIRARLRRAWRGENMRWRLGELVLQAENRRVFRGEEEIALTPREFDLLLYLVQHQTQVVTREMLGREVWRAARHTPSMDNAIDVHVAHLRRKIHAGSEAKLIHTVRGEGFVVFDAQRMEASRT